MKRLLGRLFALLACIPLSSLPVAAQTDTVVVPDLTGLNVPQAAAALNKVGLALAETVETWSASAGVPENTVGAQSVAPGQAAPHSSKIDITVLRTPNITLIYDDNELTLVNQSGQAMAFGDLAFNTVQATQAASFSAGRWAARVRPGQCTQIWSVSRNGSKGLPECQFIQNWLTTNNRGEHFWTGANGVQTFAVVQDELERAVCQAAPPNSQDRPTTCAFYLPAAGQSEFVPFIYLAYTPEKLIVSNISDAQWMQSANTTIYNKLANPAPLGAEFKFNAALFGRPEIVARINRLAPKQCLLFLTSAAADNTPPQPCDVIATMPLEPAQAFWTANFEVAGRDPKHRTCNAAVADKLTICMMPR